MFVKERCPKARTVDYERDLVLTRLPGHPDCPFLFGLLRYFGGVRSSSYIEFAAYPREYEDPATGKFVLQWTIELRVRYASLDEEALVLGLIADALRFEFPRYSVRTPDVIEIVPPRRQP